MKGILASSKSRQRFAVLVVLVVATGLAAWAVQVQYSSEPAHNQQRAALPPNSLANEGTESEQYSADPALVKGESGALLSVEDYWYTRVGYPTGRFDGRWLLDAARQDKAIQSKVPAGRVTYNKATNAMQSPLTLNPTTWTSLGPAPENEPPYGHTAGRVNDVAIDPVTPNVAYVVNVAGGVWKTTNCCSASTTFTLVSDDPLANTTAVDDISIDPSNHNNVYVGTGDLNYGSFSMGSAGILKSTDQGAHWSVKGAKVFGMYLPEPPNQFPQYQAVGKVEADPRNSNTLVVGAKTGVYFSYDGGDNWVGPCLPDTFPNQRQDVTGLILHNNGSFTDMYVAIGTRGYSTTVQYNLADNGNNGIYKSSVPSAGCPASWTISSRPDNGWPAGTASGIPVYQSGGNTVGRIDLAIAPSNPSYLYAIVQSIAQPGNVLGLWRTTDAGVTWTQTSSAPPSQNCANAPGNQNWYNQHVAVDPNNPDTVLIDTIDVYRSTNGGTNWFNLTCAYTRNNTHPDQHAIEFIPGSSSSMLVGNDGGMYVATNVTVTAPLSPTFNILNDSFNSIEIYSGDITGNFATSSAPGANEGAQDNGSAVALWLAVSPGATVTPGPTLWTQRNGGDGMFARIEPLLGQRWYQESQNGGLVVSTSGPFGGLSAASPNSSWNGDRLSFVLPYEIFKGNPNGPPDQDCNATGTMGCSHMIAGTHRVYETIQGAVPRTSWYINSPDLTKNTLADRSFINQLSYAVSISTTAIVGTNDGNVQYGFGLGQGTANSAIWVNVTDNNNILPNRPILDVATDPISPLVGYAAIGGFNANTPPQPGHVYQVTCTVNCGSFVWANKSGNLPDIPVDSIIANPRYPQQVFAGSDWGLYYTDNINVAYPIWYRFENGLPHTMIWDMQIDRGFTTLAVFTRGRGAYVWPLPSSDITPPSPTATTTPTVTNTNTPAPTNTPTNTRTTTSTITPGGPTNTPTRTPTITNTRTSTSTPTVPTSTPTCVSGYTTPVPWAVASPRPVDAYGAGAAGDASGLYVGAGYSSSTSGYTSQFAKYSPVADSWTALAPVPTTGEGIAFVYSPINNKVYAFGGGDCVSAGTVYNNTRIYDISTGTWSSGAPMPASVMQMASGYYNGKIYVAGGTNSCSFVPVQSLYVYDVLANTWTTGANLPAVVSGASGGVINGKFYVAGGRDNSNPNRTILYEYNTSTNIWATRAAMTTGVNSPASAVAGTKLWIIGGGNPFTPSGSVRPQPGKAQAPNTTAITQIYDFDTNTWSAGPTLNVGRSFVAGGSVFPYIIAVGGYDGSGSVNTTEVAVAGSLCLDATATPTSTFTATATVTPTATVTNTSTPSNTPTDTPTGTPTNTPTATPTIPCSLRPCRPPTPGT